MRRLCLLPVLLLPLLAGCASYVGTGEVAARLGGGAVVDETPYYAKLTGNGHTVRVEKDASVVFIDDSPVLLKNPTRLEDGRLKVSSDVLDHLPVAPVGPTAVTPQPTPKGPQTTWRPTAQPTVPRRYRLNRVVLDPGHGGGQDGARYGGVLEKSVNLDIALKVAAALQREGMQVTLTRTSDVTLSLQHRSDLANAVQPDIFVSIHADAASNRAARGIEVFTLRDTFADHGKHYNDASRAVAINARRDAARALSPSRYLPPPVSGPVLAKRRAQSRVLARHIETAMVRELGCPSRGLKTAGLAVLKWTAAPAVLVEVGFLSNDADRALLRTDAYRTRVAHAIVNGIHAHRDWVEQAK